MTRKIDYDTIVIGGGIIGLAAAYYSAQTGQRVLLIEKNHFYHDEGASGGGDSRMFRVMYSEPELARLAQSSLRLWEQIEKDYGSEIIQRCPLLFFGDESLGETVEGDFKNIASAMDSLQISYLRHSATEIKKAFPYFKEVPKSYVGYQQNNSGAILVQKALRAFHKLGSSQGVVFRENTTARIGKITDRSGPYEIEVGSEKKIATHLIIAPGAWAPEFVSQLGLNLKFSIWQMTYAYFACEPSLNIPMWYEFGAEGENGPNLFYGFPRLSENPKQIKVSVDFTNHKYPSVENCSRIPDPKILDKISAHVEQRFFSVASNKPLKSGTCLYSMPNDFKMILGNVPGYSRISILCGEAGRGFKFAPLFGQILAELAQKQKTDFKIDGLNPLRPGLS